MNALIFFSLTLAVASGQFFHYPQNFVFPNQVAGFPNQFAGFQSGYTFAPSTSNLVAPTFKSSGGNTPVVFSNQFAGFPNQFAGFQPGFPFAPSTSNLVKPTFKSSGGNTPVVFQPAFPAAFPAAYPVAGQSFRSSPADTNVVHTGRGFPVVAAPVVAAPVAGFVARANPTNVVHQFHAQDDAGAYEYGYYGGPSSKHEFRDHFGNVHGAFNYIDPEGNVQSQKYTANDDGFKVRGTNLPVAPAVPVAPVVVAPTPVDFTPEVKQARAEFQRAFDAEKSSNTKTHRTGFSSRKGFSSSSGGNKFGLSRTKRSADPAFAYQSTYGDTPYFYSAFPSVFGTTGVAATPYVPTPTTYKASAVQPVQYTAQTPFLSNFYQPQAVGPVSPFFTQFNFKTPQSTVYRNVDHGTGFSQFAQTNY